MPTPDYKKLKAVLDRSVKADRFTDRKLYDDTGNLREGLRARKVSTELGKLLPPAQVEVVHRRLVRAAFFIELVKRDVTSTKYDVRWTN